MAQQHTCPVCNSTNTSPSSSCPLFPAWSMDAKMDYFFEDIKPTQHIDPEVYSFWIAAVQHYLEKKKKSFTFTHEEIMLTYKRREIVTALCIGRILHEAEQHKDMVPLTSVTSIDLPPSFPYARWAINTLVVTPITAIWSYASSLAYDEDDYHVTSYRPSAVGGRPAELKKPQVNLILLRKAAQVLNSYASGKMEWERTVSLDVAAVVPSPQGQETVEMDTNNSSNSGACTWKETCQAAALEEKGRNGGTAAGEGVLGILEEISQQDCIVLADYMVASGLAVKKGSYLKVLGMDTKGDDRTKKRKGSHTGITEADRKVLDFRIKVGKLEASLGQRERDMKTAKEKATLLHKQGLSHQARVELMRYKKLEELVTKLRTAVVNLLSIHYSIEGVGTDMAIFTGLKGGNEALKEQKAANALTVKDVDEAMTEAQDLISQTQEVGMALAQPLSEEAATTAEEEADLLRELEALELQLEQAPAAAATATIKKPTEDIASMLPDISHLATPSAAATSSSSISQGKVKKTSPQKKMASSASS